MNTRQLQYVCTVAEELSFSEAAVKLMISQPSLSQYIQKLEQELGIAVFERTTPLKLTFAGEVYLETARKILDCEKQLQNTIIDIKNEKIGRLVIGAGPFNSTYILPPIIAKFRAEYPNIEIVLVEMVETELLQRAKKGEYDLVITTLPVDTREFVFHNIMKEDIVLVVPSNYSINDFVNKIKCESEFPEVDLTEFADQPFVLLKPGFAMRRLMDEISSKAGFQPNSAVECYSITTAFSMVQAGVGITIVPSSLIKFRKELKGVYCYSIKQCDIKRDLNVFYRKGQYIPKSGMEFIEMIKEF